MSLRVLFSTVFFVCAGKMMLKRYPTEMKAVFLHTVWDNHEGPPDENAWTDTEVKSVPVLYFRTYVGAARKAVEQNLIDEKALRRYVKA